MFDNELVDQQIAISGTGEPHRRTLEREVEDIVENRPSGLFRETSEMVHAQDCGILQPPFSTTCPMDQKEIPLPQD